MYVYVRRGIRVIYEERTRGESSSRLHFSFVHLGLESNKARERGEREREHRLKQRAAFEGGEKVGVNL